MQLKKSLLQILKERASRITPEYSFNIESQRYRNKTTGRFVSAKAVRNAIDKVIDGSGKAIDDLSQQLKEGKINLADWQEQMVKQIKSNHIASASAAKGGWHQMTLSDYGRAGGRIRGQLLYLRRFAQEIEAGKQKLDGIFIRRARMYVEAGRETYHLQLRSEMEAAGMSKERNILGIADHCDDCKAETAKGWVSIGELSMPGTRRCLKNCKCRLEYE